MTDEMRKVLEEMSPEERKQIRRQIDEALKQSIFDLSIRRGKFWLLFGDEVREQSRDQ